jgi:hypothetical protein
MDPVNSAIVNNASSADLSTIQGNASVLVMKKALDAQASGAAQLIAALPQPALATSGTVGTQVNTFA